jgi:hypothetical protein
MDQDEHQIGQQAQERDDANRDIEAHDATAPLQPAAKIGKAVERSEKDQQARDIGDVEHLTSPVWNQRDDRRGRCKFDRSIGGVARKGRVKILGDGW